MSLAVYIGLLHGAQTDLGDAFERVAGRHSDEHDVVFACERLARQCRGHVERLAPFVEKYGERGDDEPDRLYAQLFRDEAKGGLGLMRDLNDLYVMASECDITWTLIGQGAQGARDPELLEVVEACEGETAIQLKWLRTRLKQAAPQALVVSS